MKLNFTKMHGCGNDYIYINCFDSETMEENLLKSYEKLFVYMSDRHFGIGGDGVVLILRSLVADAKMRMFNLDGSEGKMCGNAIRCVAKYLYDNKIVQKDQIDIETLSGIKKLQLFTQNEQVYSVKVDMGKAELTPSLIPVKCDSDSDRMIDKPITVAGKTYNITAVSMGNPHAVIFDWKVESNLEQLDIKSIGSQIENSEYFPEKVNVEFAKIINRNHIKMRVWERGSGETLACGTGACAVVVAAVENDLCDKNTEVTVELLGGNLSIKYTDETVYMTGGCTKVFDGTIEV